MLEENNVLTRSIHLNGTNAIPADCNLLVIAGLLALARCFMALAWWSCRT